MDLINGFKCECPRGYYDARCLSDVDECASNPCINNGRCEDGVNQFICHCPPGYGGKRCEVDIGMFYVAYFVFISFLTSLFLQIR